MYNRRGRQRWQGSGGVSWSAEKRRGGRDEGKVEERSGRRGGRRGAEETRTGFEVGKHQNYLLIES